MKRFAIAALSLLILGTMVTPVLAQLDQVNFYQTPMGSIYVSKEPDSYVPHWQLYLPFTVGQKVYVVADVDFADIGAASQNLSNGIRAWEGGVTLPPAVNVISHIVVGGIDLGSGPGDYIVGMGNPVLASSTPLPLVTYEFFATSPIETFEMQITESSAPSFPVLNSSIWLEQLTLNGCQNTVSLLPTQCFFVWEFMGSMMISSGITTESESWGGLKTRFDR